MSVAGDPDAAAATRTDAHMTIHSPASSQPSGHLSLEQFAEAAKGNESVYLSISGQSMQVLGMGTTPGGRAVAWVAPDVDTTRMFTEALQESYGPGIAKAIAQELGLQPSPGKPLSARTVMHALDMARTAGQALSGIDFVTALEYSAQNEGLGFKSVCQELNLDPGSLDAQQREAIDHALQERFQQAASEGRSPVPPETVRSWLHEVLRN